MNDIDTTFAQAFKTWDIELPPATFDQKQPGLIRKGGWNIRYAFGENYLDYYATHRMTSGRHVRIHADGRTECLEIPHEFIVYPKGADEEARSKAEEDYYAHNRVV